MSYPLRNVFDLGPAYTGKTLYAQIGHYVTGLFVNVDSEITNSAHEVTGAQGLFEQDATIPDGTTGFMRVYTSDNPGVILFSVPLNPVEIELNAIADAIMRRGRAHSDGLAEEGSLYELTGAGLQSETVEDVWNIFASDGATVFNTRSLTLGDNFLPVGAVG